ncbi:hypothetical protein DRD23_09615 [Salmonella enterica subsp. enterica serovar Enteritidis]|nr:hypothetical protein [Salmonella enterica subsp. enterica serovar Enteritidis]
MTLTEIRNERNLTRLKTSRWHELNKMEGDRIAEINVKHGGESNPHHGKLYHRSKAEEFRIKSQSKTLPAYLKRSHSLKMQAHHERIAAAMEE